MQLRQRQHVVVTLRFPGYAAEVDSNTEPKMRKDPGWGVMKCQTLTSLWGFFLKVGWLKFEVHGARGAAQVSLSFAGWMWDYSFVWIWNLSWVDLHIMMIPLWYLMNLRIILSKLLGIKQFRRDLHDWGGHRFSRLKEAEPTFIYLLRL